MISGLQHFVFCRRQWALIHIEEQWQENLRTVEGDILHERVHDETFAESRKNLLTMRGMRVRSPALGVSGACDLVEFISDDQGVTLAGREGKWKPYPVEFKRGESKESTDADRLQLCCQAMCLEEMLCCAIPEGALFYGQTRRRENISFTEELRETVRAMLREMHEYARRGYTPKVKTGAHCRACSLKDICLPILSKNISADAYLREALERSDP